MTKHYFLLNLLIIFSTGLFSNLKDLNLSLVKILSFDNSGNKLRATGFNICKEGLIITNAHVLKYSKKILVIDHNLNELPFISIIAKQKNPDLAIIKVINKSKIPPIDFLTFGILEEGDLAYFLDKAKKIYGKLVDVERDNGFYISNDIDYGHSGSPLFNKQNQLVGVVFAKRVLHFKKYGKVDMGGYAIPSRELVNFIRKNISLSSTLKSNDEKEINILVASSDKHT